MRVVAALAIASSVACGGNHGSTADAPTGDGSGSGSDDGGMPADAGFDADTGSGFRIAGTALGIRQPVQLTATVGGQARTIVVTEDGPFHFSRRYPASTTFTVTTTAPGTECQLVAATGTITTADSNVQLYCIGVVELNSVAFTPSVLPFTPTFSAGARTYTGERPLFLEANSLISTTATAAYAGEALISINGGSATSGVAKLHAYGANVAIDVTHSTTLSAHYTFDMTRKWHLEAYAKAPDSAANMNFGGGSGSKAGTFCTSGNANNNGIAISGDVMVVGAPCKTSNTGAAYVFRRSNVTWAYEQTLTASNAAVGDQFGANVAIDGDTIVVGAPYANTAKGAAYVYVHGAAGATWTQQQILTATLQDSSDKFGFAVAISGDTVAIGAPGEDTNANTISATQPNNNSLSESGAVFVMTRSGTMWSLQAFIKASNASMNASFGSSVSLSGSTLAVGAPYEDTTNIDSGEVYAFAFSTSWSQKAALKLPTPLFGENFGFSVSVDGNVLAAGAPDRDIQGSVDVGAVYTFVPSGATWIADATLTLAGNPPGLEVGYAVAVDNGHVIASILGGVPDPTFTSIIAWRKDPTTGAWNEQHTISTLNTEAADLFGSSVAVDGDTFAAAACQEDSASQAILTTPPTDNGRINSGAVYVFR